METYEGELVMLSPNCRDIYFLHVYVNKYTHKQTPPAIPLLISNLEEKNSSLDKCLNKVIFSQYKA